MVDIKNVLVTGGSGRLGRYVVACLRDTFEVTIFDRKVPDVDCPFVQGDILDAESIGNAISGMDAVVHLAALDADVSASDSEFIKVNVEGTWNIFNSAREAGVKKVVHCSSVAAVNISPENPPQYLPVDIDHPADPEIAYGLSKLMGEKIARRFALLGGMDVVCLRPTLILPPEYVYDVARTSTEVDGTPPPPTASDPSWKSWDEVIPGSRAYVDPRDVATAFRAALLTEDIPWGVYFVTADDTYSGLDTLEVVRREFGVEPDLRDTNRFTDRPRASIYDTAETTRVLGWKPVHDWPAIYRNVLGVPWTGS